MGGLSKYMPTTYKTMLVGWLAICGIIPLAGFWSKDEILWKTFSTGVFSGGKVLWFIGFLTAGMTAFYMTRLIALTFWGEERFRKVHAGGEADEAHAAAHDKGIAPHDALIAAADDRPHHEPGEHVGAVDATDRQAAHGIPHPHFEPHESPRSMTLPLVVLAFFSIFVGFVGIPHLNMIEHWLDPVIVNVHNAPEAENASSAVVRAVATAPEPAVAETHAAEASEGLSGVEVLLMVLSLGVAVGGIMLGRRFYLSQPDLPGIWTRKLKPLYKLSFNKWYWDYLLDVKGVRAGKEINSALFAVDSGVVDGAVNEAGWLTRSWAWISGIFDKYVVDVMVNMTGWITRAGSIILRSFQTGFWQNYALLFSLGLFVVLLFFTWHAITGGIKTFFGGSQ